MNGEQVRAHKRPAVATLPSVTPLRSPRAGLRAYEWDFPRGRAFPCFRTVACSGALTRLPLRGQRRSCSRLCSGERTGFPFNPMSGYPCCVDILGHLR